MIYTKIMLVLVQDYGGILIFKIFSIFLNQKCLKFKYLLNVSSSSKYNLSFELTGLNFTVLKSSFSFEIAVKGYNPAPREMRGNLMDSNLEQDTIRELGMRKQVCE